MPSTYKNPVICGFAPDPSAIFVDGTFFLVNSSFHLFPGIPVYASKNLISWTQIGNAINRRSQLSLANAPTETVTIRDGATIVTVGGLYAPTIRYFDGTFYIICTNICKDGKGVEYQNFYISTTDIWSDKWSDIVSFDFHGIDPSLFFDDDGRSYVQGSFVIDYSTHPSCTIKQFEIDIHTGRPLSEQKEIWGGFAQIDTEGPHVFKKDGYYYLMAAEGGTFQYHMLCIARAVNIWGPYEAYENNPILTASGTREYIQNIGHGDLFQDGDSMWWAVLLGVRNGHGRYPLGRETFLTPVTWPTGGWPKLETVKTDMENPAAAVLSINGDISISARLGYNHIRDAVLENYRFSEEGNAITLVASKTDLLAPKETVTFIGKRQVALQSISTVSLILEDVEPTTALKAGLVVYKDDYRHAAIFYDQKMSAVRFNALNKATGFSSSSMATFFPIENVEFGIFSTEASYQFHYRRIADPEWTLLSSIDTIQMTGNDFTGTLFGIFASGEEPVDVVFQNFEIAER